MSEHRVLNLVTCEICNSVRGSRICHACAMKRIKELEADRDDYKARWEATGCARHGAMETAIALNKKTQAKLDAVNDLLFGLDEPLTYPVDVDRLNTLFRKLRKAAIGEQE